MAASKHWILEALFIRNGVRLLLSVPLALVLFAGFSAISSPRLYAQVKQSVLASDPHTSQSNYKLGCAEGVCTVRSKYGPTSESLLFQLAASALRGATSVATNPVAGHNLSTTNHDILLHLPLGDIHLLETDLEIELSPDQSIERLFGTAQVPMSLLGLLNDTSLVRAEIGLDYGDRLREQLAGEPIDSLVPTKQYFYFRLQPGAQTPPAKSDNSEPLALSIPTGRQLLIIHDPMDLYVYSDGFLNIDFPGIRHTFPSSLVGGTLGAGALLPSLLVDHSAGIHVSWLISDEPSASFLQIDGNYVLSEGMISRLTGTEMGDLGLAGSMKLSADGILIRGVTDAALVSGVLFDSGLELEAFVPFRSDFWQSHVVVGGHVAVPMLAVQADGEKRIEGTLIHTIASGVLPRSMLAPRSTIYVMAKDRTADAVILAGKGIESVSDAASYSYQWTVSTTTAGVSSASRAATARYHSVLDFAAGQFGWVSSQITHAADSAAENTRNSFHTSKNMTIQGYNRLTNAISNTASEMASTTQSRIDQTGQAVRDVTVNSIEDTQQLYGSAERTISSTIYSAVTSASTGIERATDIVSDTRSVAVQTIGASVESANSSAQKNIASVSSGISNTINSAVEFAGGFFPKDHDEGEEPASCSMGRMRIQWCRHTGRCEIPPECLDSVNSE